MNINLEKSSSTDALISIRIEESDYQQSLDQKIRDYARKANIRGFRQGKVPAGVVRNMFGKSFLADEVNNLISKSLSGYIRENKLPVLGEPMPDAARTPEIDWESQKDFEFVFRLGLSGSFEVKLSPDIRVKRHVITVDDATVTEAVEQARKRYGQISYPETSSAADQLYGKIRQAGSEESKTGVIVIEKLTEAARSKFIGLQKEASVEFLVEDLSTDASVLAQILNLPEEEAGARTGMYHFTVDTISHTEPANLDKEFFDKVFGPDQVNSEDEFRNKVRETIAQNYLRESDHLVDHELEHYFTDHIKIDLPEAFLRDWLRETGEGKITDEVLEREFGIYLKETRWNLVRNRIAEEHEVKVEQEDVRERAKAMILEQFGGPAIAAQLGDRLDAFADNYLQGNEGQNFMRIYNQLRDERIIRVIREKITIEDVPVTLDEFRKAVESHRHHHN